jgi:serine/threonine protein phosphatase 1
MPAPYKSQLDMRKFVVGDIHGCYDELMELIQKVGLKDGDMLISLGDIVDRGNKSKEVYEYFLKRPNSIVLIGNHERKHQNGVLSYAQEIVKVQMGSDYDGFLKWINTLEYFYETEEAIVIHAFFEHDKELNAQKQEVLSGSTSGDRYLEKKYPVESHWTDFYSGSKPIIYGHHVVGDDPKISNNTYGIDTGACHGNYLTAIELPGFIVHQVKARKDYWKEEQKKWQIPVLEAKNWNDMEFGEIEKQLGKLAYIQGAEVVSYLSEKAKWKQAIEDSFKEVKEQVDNFTRNLTETHGDKFGIEAEKMSFKTYIFQSKKGSLTIESLKKGINTPNKLMGLQRELKMNP